MFPPNWQLEPFPSTARRMEIYEKASVDLAEQAARGALAEAGIDPSEVTHLVICTCTGFFAPGPDILLARRLGLRPTVARSILGFMGCYAGFNGMRSADQIVRSQPRAVVLHVCVELCTLHFQKKASPDLLIANCLFSDGCAAAVYAAPGRGGKPLALVAGNHSHVEGDSLDQMTWHIGDTGFEMRLSVQVPRTLGRQAAPFVEALLDRASLARKDVASWAVHPGGRKIVEALAAPLDLGEEDLAPSYGVLNDYGNMSSATIYFVLDRRLRDGGPAGPVVALGFGPGLTMEGAVLVRE
jgi:alpha-pyrone synthase